MERPQISNVGQTIRERGWWVRETKGKDQSPTITIKVDKTRMGSRWKGWGIFTKKSHLGAQINPKRESQVGGG
jgi:hypothetical protein